MKNESHKNSGDELNILRQRISKLESENRIFKKSEEEALTKSNLLEVILATTDILVAYLDPRFNYIKVNEAYALAHNKNDSFYPGKNLFDLYPNEEQRRIFQQVVDTGNPYVVSAKPLEHAEHPERGISYWDWGLKPAKNTSGAVTGLVLTMLDVSEHIKGEQELKGKNIFLRTLIDSIYDPVYFKDNKGKNIIVNKAFEVFTGLKREDIEGKTDRELLPVDLADYAHKSDMEVMKRGKALREEQVMTVENGTVYFFDTVKCPVFDSDGKHLGIVGVSRDITDQKMTQDELQFRSAITEQLNTSVITTDLEYRITWVNKAFNREYGFSSDEVIGRTPDYLNVDPLSEKIQEDIYETVSSGKVWIGKAMNRRKDGSTFLCAIEIFPLMDRNGNIFAYAGQQRDISRLNQLEEAQQKMSKLESIGILAGGIAHDFNNILTGIRNSIYLSKLHITHNAKAMTSLDAAEKAIQRATNLTQQLLTFSKGGTPVKKKASIRDIITESTEFVLRGSNVQCEYSIDSDLWSVNVDVGQIHQVIHNIVLNAVQAMPGGVKIHIGLQNYVLKHETNVPLDPGNYLKINIQDQGAGIKTDNLDKIFDPYFTTKDAGRGLGLSITYSIIVDHDGFISVDSKEDRGTTFTIYLPADISTLSSEELTAERPPKGDGRKILIMDDEEVIRDTVSEFLTIKGYSVESARDGTEAVRLYKVALDEESPFDAVILDLTIRGGMGGRETLRNLIDLDPHVKAIVSSGYSNDPVMANYKDYDFCDVFSKASNSPDDLCTILNRVIHNDAE